MPSESIWNKKISLPKMNRITKLAILVLLILGSWFYWFQYRPSKIRAECAEKAKEFIRDSKDLSFSEGIAGYELVYKNCLRSKGISE